MSKDLANQKAKFPNQPFVIWQDDNTGEVHTIKSDEDIAGIVHLPRSTIYDRRKYPKKFIKDTFGPGPATILDTFLENEIVNHCTTLCDKGFGISWKGVKFIAWQLASDPESRWYVPNFVASNGWLQRFRSRHPQLSARIAQNLERTRAGALNKDIVEHYFRIVEQMYEQIVQANRGAPITPDLIYNLDETGFDQANLTQAKVVCLKARRTQTHRRTNATRTHMSACVAVNAAGHRIPTMYCLKGKAMIRLKELPHCPDGVIFTVTEKGYFNDEAFYEYVVHFCSFIPDDNKWRGLILDGYGSHTLCYKSLKYFYDHKVHVCCMPSHTSSMLQPLDVACFGPTKGYFQFDVTYLNQHLGDYQLNRLQTPCVFELALKKGCSRENIISGFKVTGLWPLTVDWCKKNRSKLQISETIANNSVENVDIETATAVEVNRVIDEQSSVLKNVFTSMCDKNYLTDECRNHLESGIAEIELVLEQYVRPVLKRLSLAFGGPENPRAKKQVPKGKRKRTTNTLGESFAEAKLLTFRGRLEELKDLNLKVLEDNKVAEREAEQRYLDKLERQRNKQDAIEHEKPLLTLLFQKQYLHHMKENMTVAVMRTFLKKNKELVMELDDEGKFPIISKFKRSDYVNYIYEIELCEHADRIANA